MRSGGRSGIKSQWESSFLTSLGSPDLIATCHLCFSNHEVCHHSTDCPHLACPGSKCCWWAEHGVWKRTIDVVQSYPGTPNKPKAHEIHSHLTCPISPSNRKLSWGLQGGCQQLLLLLDSWQSFAGKEGPRVACPVCCQNMLLVWFLPGCCTEAGQLIFSAFTDRVCQYQQAKN